MQFSKWKEVAELVGLGAIVASLIFVGLQLKQSQEIALANQYQARAEAVQELILAHIEVGYIPFIPELRRGAENGASVEDIHTVHWLWIQMDNHYYQYRPGFFPKTRGMLSYETRGSCLSSAIFGSCMTGGKKACAKSSSVWSLHSKTHA